VWLEQWQPCEPIKEQIQIFLLFDWMTWFLLWQSNMYHLAVNDLYDVITTAQTLYLFAGYSQAYINPRP